ncbi:hypothetical protein A2U01_0096933, partial [Trifolium medium]|nr:hypothetical protein [Trifolium medium]
MAMSCFTLLQTLQVCSVILYKSVPSRATMPIILWLVRAIKSFVVQALIPSITMVN